MVYFGKNRALASRIILIFKTTTHRLKKLHRASLKIAFLGLLQVLKFTKNNEARKEKSETQFFRPIYVDQIPHKSLVAHVNVFSNKPNIAQHHNYKENVDVAYYGLYDQNKI